MNEILAALGLPENATTGQAVDAIEALKLKSKGLPKDIDPVLLQQKIAAGLDKETAIAVIRAQAAEDAANTPAPKGRKG